jgi:hypothetical protein
VHPTLADTAGLLEPRRGDATYARPLPEDLSQAVLAKVGIDYVSEWEGRAVVSRDFFTMTANLEGPLDVAGFDQLIETDVVRSGGMGVGPDTLAFDSLGAGRFRVRWRGRDVGTLRLDSLLAGVEAGRPRQGDLQAVPRAERTIDLVADSVRLRFVFRHIGGTLAAGTEPLHVNTAAADILIDRR